MSSDVQTVGRTKSDGFQVRAQHHAASGNDGGDATSRCDYRHGEATRGQRLRSAVERGDCGVRGDVVQDIIVRRWSY